MRAYQSDIAKFEAAGSQVVGISVDSGPANKHWAEHLGVTFPILSDMRRKAVRDYGIFNEEAQIGRRATFVVDKNGIIQHVEEGKTAVDPTGAHAVCARLK